MEDFSREGECSGFQTQNKMENRDKEIEVIKITGIWKKIKHESGLPIIDKEDSEDEEITVIKEVYQVTKCNKRKRNVRDCEKKDKAGGKASLKMVKIEELDVNEDVQIIDAEMNVINQGNAVDILDIEDDELFAEISSETQVKEELDEEFEALKDSEINNGSYSNPGNNVAVDDEANTIECDETQKEEEEVEVNGDAEAIKAVETQGVEPVQCKDIKASVEKENVNEVETVEVVMKENKREKITHIRRLTSVRKAVSIKPEGSCSGIIAMDRELDGTNQQLDHMMAQLERPNKEGVSTLACTGTWRMAEDHHCEVCCQGSL